MEKRSKEKHLSVEPLDVEKFIKMNELKPISNPVFFSRSGVPTTDGLLSNEIFGISKDDSGKVHYISIEGPDKENDYYDLVNTFVSEK